MRIQYQAQSIPPTRGVVNQPGSDRPVSASAKDVALLGEIRSQERIMRLSHAVPWGSALVTATSVYYLANHSLAMGTTLGLPVGLLLGAGIAEYMSDQAAFKIQEAEAQLDQTNGDAKPTR